MLLNTVLKTLSPATGETFGIILLLSVAGLFWYGNQRIDALKTENQWLTEQYDEVETQLLEFEARYDEQQQAIILALQQQADIREKINQKKNKVTKQTGVRRHAAKENPDALGDAITDSLTDIMQQLKNQTSH